MAPTAHLAHLEMQDKRWLEFCARTPCSLFQTPKWCQFISSQFNFDAKVLAVLEGDEVVGGLPYSRIVDFRGELCLTFPFTDVCNPVGAPSLTQYEKSLLDCAPWRIRCTQKGALGMVTSSGSYQTLELSTESVGARKRMNTSRAETAGAVCKKITAPEAVDLFYPVYSRLRKGRLRVLPQPRQFFDQLVSDYFPDNGFALIASLGDEVLAAMMVLCHDDVAYCKYFAWNLWHSNLRPTDYLIGKAVDCAFELGFTSLDLGISTTDGLAQYKQRLGAQSVPFFTCTYGDIERSATSVQLENAIRETIAIITAPNIPVQAAERAGAVLYRFFA